MGWLATVSKFFKWINFGLSSPPIWQTFEKSNQNFLKDQKPNDLLHSEEKKFRRKFCQLKKKFFSGFEKVFEDCVELVRKLNFVAELKKIVMNFFLKRTERETGTKKISELSLKWQRIVHFDSSSYFPNSVKVGSWNTECTKGRENWNASGITSGYLHSCHSSNYLFWRKIDQKLTFIAIIFSLLENWTQLFFKEHAFLKFPLW